MARVANKTFQGRRNQRGFLAAGLGIAIFAIFAVFSGISAGVVANKEGERDQVVMTEQTETAVAYVDYESHRD